MNVDTFTTSMMVAAAAMILGMSLVRWRLCSSTARVEPGTTGTVEVRESSAHQAPGGPFRWSSGHLVGVGTGAVGVRRESVSRWAESVSHVLDSDVAPNSAVIELLPYLLSETFADPDSISVENVSRALDVLRANPVPVEDLGFTVRTYNALKRRHLNDTWDLLVAPVNSFDRAPGEAPMAESSFGEVLSAVYGMASNLLVRNAAAITETSSAWHTNLGPRIEVYLNADDSYGVRVRGQSETFSLRQSFGSRESALEAARHLLRAVREADVVETTDPGPGI